MSADPYSTAELPIDIAESDRCLVASDRDTRPDLEVFALLGSTAATGCCAGLTRR